MRSKRINKILVFIIIIIITIYGCSDKNDRIYDQETVKINKPELQPLKHAFGLIGLNMSNLKRPEYYDEGYNMICRIPIIDKIANDPFYMLNWAEEASNRIQEDSENGLNDILNNLTEIIFLDKDKKQFDSIYDDQHCEKKGLDDAYIDLCNAHNSKALKSEIDKIRNAGFSKTFDNELYRLVYTISQASLFAKKAFSNLTKEESEFLLSRPERFFFPNGIQFEFLTAPVYTQEKISFITRRIDFKRLYYSASLIALGVERFSSFVRSQKNQKRQMIYFKDNKTHVGIILKISSPIGDIVILGQGANITYGNAAIVIDLGGNDKYFGDTANGRLMPGRISVTIDVDGDDIYNNKQSPFSQGFGCLSIGVLSDLEGNDRYISGNMAQGCGIYGIGILEDSEGSDVYLMGIMGQGFGVFGTGILLDRKGNDRYMINGMGQGAGSTMGNGFIIDMNGNDKYIADSNKTRGNLIPDELMNHVQGAGLSIRSPEWINQLSLYGGVGFLNDGNGDDLYYSNGGNCMGSSYFMSVGAFVDHSGDDTYIAEKGYGIGSAVHLANAVFIDKKGKDRYFAVYHSGGAASDQSVGIMTDYEGDDIYGPNYIYLKEKVQKEFTDKKEKITKSELEERINEEMADASYGASLKPRALGILIDYKGDDQYFSKKGGYGESCGGVIPPVYPENWSHSILMDLKGDDYYYNKGRKDNHYFRYFKHAICYDTNFQGKRVIIDPQRTVKPGYISKQDHIEMGFTGKIVDKDISDFYRSDSFKRYRLVGKIINKGPDTVFEIIDLLKDSYDNELNRYFIEILNIFVTKEQFGRKHKKQFEKLLDAKAPFIRSYAAHTLGLHKSKDSIPLLAKKINDENEEARYKIIWALGQMDSSDTCGVLIEVAQKEPSVDCRRAAMRGLNNLTRINKSENLKCRKRLKEIILKNILDKDETIRVYASLGLGGYADDLEVQRALRELLKDESVYVRRSSAKTLIESGQIEGIPVLIETLRYPSIDTFEFYDNDLIKEISFYCGVDFPKDERYLYSVWKKWWIENKKNIDLERNLSIMKDIKSTFYVKNEQNGIKIFRRLIAENPENIVVKNQFVTFCNHWINYRLLTREKITKSILERCVILQKIILEIEPQLSKHMVRLAKFYARLSRFEKAAEVIKSAIQMEPENKGYLTLLNEYEKMAGK